MSEIYSPVFSDAFAFKSRFLGCVCLQIALPKIAARPIYHNAVMPVETPYWAS